MGKSRCSTWNVSFFSIDEVNVDMIQAQCSIAVWKTFFLWMFKVFSLLSSYQIDPIFLLSITLLFLEMRSTVFKNKVKILFFVLQINVKH